VLQIVEDIMPDGELAWDRCASRYWTLSGERELRQGDDFKRYFVEKCCKRGKKPTGSSAPALSVKEAQRIYAKILEKNEQRNFGGSDSGSSDSEDEGGDPCDAMKPPL
jgi:hypothetical protein